MPPMRIAGPKVIGIALGVFVMLASGCAATVKRERGVTQQAADFFPLIPSSHWEYLVTRRTDGVPLRFVATVRPDEFKGPNGHGCRIVDERYGDRPAGERIPIVYCTEGGFLHRVMSLEYRGESLEDNGLRSGELKFLPVNLGGTHTWEGRTNAYQLSDGSGFEVRQLHQVLRATGSRSRCPQAASSGARASRRRRSIRRRHPTAARSDPGSSTTTRIGMRPVWD